MSVRAFSRRAAHSQEDCINLSSDSETELPDSTIDLTVENDEIVDLTSVNDTSVLVLDTPRPSGRIQSRRSRGRGLSRLQTRSRNNSFINDSTNLLASDAHQTPDHLARVLRRQSDDLSDEENLPNIDSLDTSFSVDANDKSSIDNQSCPLCLETFRKIKNHSLGLVATTCGHVFCKRCAKKHIAINKFCPVCRSKLTMKSIHPLYI